MVCDWQIFSGCVCHLEQLHAQSPFLFPIVFGINLFPSFDIASVCCPFSLSFGYVLLYLGHCTVTTVAVCGFGSWALVFHCGFPRQISSLHPTPSQTEVCSTIGESIRLSSFHNPTLSANKHVVFCRSSLSAAADHLADGTDERRTSPFISDAQSGNGRSLSRAVVQQSLAVSATTFTTALSLHIAQGCLRKESAIQVVLKGRTVAI